MTAPDPRSSRAFFEAAGGEVLEAVSQDGNQMILNALPIPDGTVRVMLTIVIPDIGPFGLQVVGTSDQVRAMGELLTRVAAR